ncbi:MAG TPA: hypothetical protein ENK56_09420, partial [Chloroflexi bacterium]|nr:hypothetical protein [Chloroflexota bacterium]
MKTLVTLLGTAPGTVTATYYALGEQGYDLPDRVVVVATESRETDECLKMIRRKFRRPTADEPPGPDLEAVLVPIADLEDEESTRTFQARVAEVLRQERERPDNEVWLSIAGGRKSMAALAAMAAQFIGVQRMFHLYVSPDLERYGDINQLLLEPEWQQRSLHPAQEDYTLVEVPFFEVGVERETLHLLLRGKPDAFVHQVVQAKPALLAKLPDETIRAYWDYVFQEYGSPPQYEELTVCIGPRPSPEEDFPVLAHGEGVGDLHSTFVPLFDPAEVAALFQALADRSQITEAAPKAQDLGRKLFNGLFSGSLLEAFRQAQKQAKSLGLLRLRLRLDPEARLGDLPLRQLPWELLHDGER